MFKSLDNYLNNQKGESSGNYIQNLKEEINLSIRVKYRGQKHTTCVEIIDNESIIFRCPIDEYEIIRFINNQTMRVEFIGYSGLYTATIVILENLMIDNKLYYKGKVIGDINKIQKRQSNRISVMLDITYTKGKYEYIGNVLNISANGMLLETDENMLTNKKIKMNFDIENKLYQLEGTLLKKTRNYNNNRYLYNVKFNNLNSRGRKEILRYIDDNLKQINNTM